MLVKDEVVALADDTRSSGAECTDSGAKVELDGAVLAEGEEVPSEQGNPDSEPIAAVTGDEIGCGRAGPREPHRAGPLGIHRRQRDHGARQRRVRLSGSTSTIGFTGTLRNLDNWSVNLSSSALTIPGITSSPATFTGTLRSATAFRRSP